MGNMGLGRPGYEKPEDPWIRELRLESEKRAIAEWSAAFSRRMAEEERWRRLPWWRKAWEIILRKATLRK